jgi:hypothetical protein
MAKGERWQGIPTELSLERFREFVLPHLSAGSRGPDTKLSPHALFNYILESAEFSATLLRLVTCAHSRRARVR